MTAVADAPDAASTQRRAVADRVAALSPEQRAVLLDRLRRQRPAAAPAETWIQRYRPAPTARLRLFCFAYAGGGASVFRSWGADLPPQVEVCAVALPGREARLGEPAFRRIAPLAEAVAGAIAPYLDRPFAFFGHSMGALLAFEVVRQLRRTARPLPSRLALAAFRAPQLPNPNIRIHHLPDEVFKVVLRSEGVPETVLQNDELMRAMLPTLRADFEACDTYEYVPEAPLPGPMSVFGGTDDVRVKEADLAQWREHTADSCDLTMLPGGHFFVHSARAELLATISGDLARDLHLDGDRHHE